MLTFPYLSTRNLKHLIDFNGMGNFTNFLLLFRSWSCTTNIYEIEKSVSSSIEKVEYADQSLYRRHVNDWSNQKGGGVDQGHSHLVSATLRVASEFKEIFPSSISGNRISGLYSKLCESDPLTALTQGAWGRRGVHRDIEQELDIAFGIDQTFRPLVVNHSNSCTRFVINWEF